VQNAVNIKEIMVNSIKIEDVVIFYSNNPFLKNVPLAAFCFIIFICGCFSAGEKGLWWIPSQEKGVKIALDSNENCYVLGVFSGPTDFDPGPETDIRNTDGLSDISLIKYNYDANIEWVYTWEGHKESIHIFDLFVDRNGFIYASGDYSADFETPYTTFLTKFGRDGNILWSHNWQGRDFQDEIVVLRLSLNNSGNLLMGGRANEATDLDPGDEIRVAGENNCFIAEFDPDGSFIRSDTWPIADAYYLEILSDESVYAITYHEYRHNVYALIENGDTELVYSWDASTRNGSGGYLAVDKNGNLVLAGSTSGSFIYDSESSEYEWEYSDGDVFLKHFDNEGNLAWSHTLGGDGEDYPCCVSIDKEGNILIAGVFENTVDFDPGQGTDEHIAKGYLDIFLSKYSPDGSTMWTRTWGGTDPSNYSDMPYDIEVTSRYEILITGVFSGNVDFNPGREVTIYKSIGENDAFLCKFDLGGNLLWTRTWGGENRGSNP